MPGSYPYTRGIHRTGYRGKPWTIRMFSGFGSVEETNRRYRDLLANGNDGLSVAFDMPTLMGYDHDDPWAQGEFGSRRRRRRLARRHADPVPTDIPLDAPHDIDDDQRSRAGASTRMLVATAEEQGASRGSLSGTLQNDILKEFIAQNEFIFPPKHSVRLVTDTIEFAAREMPKWNPISVSGYHIREAGATAAQELAFTLADGHRVRALGDRARPATR